MSIYAIKTQRQSKANAASVAVQLSDPAAARYDLLSDSEDLFSSDVTIIRKIQSIMYNI